MVEGDIFALDADALGPVDAVLDRAALIALPDGMRARYAAHLARLAGCAPILLVTFEYPEGVLEGPPFSVPVPQAEALFAQTHRAELLESVAAWFRDGIEGREHALLLRPF